VANLPAVGMPGDPGTVLNLLVVVVMLVGILKGLSCVARSHDQGRLEV
jgi:hypothetical protein